MAEQRVVVDRELRVERLHLAGRRDDQRVDLAQHRVLVDERGIQASGDRGDLLLLVRIVDAAAVDQRAGVPGLEALEGVDAVAGGGDRARLRHAVSVRRRRRLRRPDHGRRAAQRRRPGAAQGPDPAGVRVRPDRRLGRRRPGGLTQLMPGTAVGARRDQPARSRPGDRGRREVPRPAAEDASAATRRSRSPPTTPARARSKRYGGVPPYAETQQYVQKVLGYAAAYRGSLA